MGIGEEEAAENPEEESASEESDSSSLDSLPARADRDRFAPLGQQVGNPDKACLSCMVVIVIAVLVLIACLVFYYLKNDAFHRS